MNSYLHRAAVRCLLVAMAGCGGSSVAPPLRRFQPVEIPAGATAELKETLNTLNSADPAERIRAATRLGEIAAGDSSVIAFLLHALGDPHPAVRSRAAESLGRCGGPVAIRPLIERLQAPGEDREVRTHAAEALGRLKAKDAVPALIAAVKDPVWHVRHHAIEALGQIGDAAASAALAEAVRYDPDHENRQTAAGWLGKLSSHGA